MTYKRSLCKHCQECKDYTYERKSKKGKYQTFQYCNGGLEKIRLSNWYIKSDDYVYSSTKINGKQRLFHTLFKTNPKLVIDHVNGDRKDNRLRNLREITSLCNCQNSHNHKRTSIYPGVFWNKMTKNWNVHIRFNGKLHSKSGFGNELEVYDYYVKKIKSTGRHINTETLAHKVYVEWKYVQDHKPMELKAYDLC